MVYFAKPDGFLWLVFLGFNMGYDSMAWVPQEFIQKTRRILYTRSQMPQDRSIAINELITINIHSLAFRLLLSRSCILTLKIDQIYQSSLQLGSQLCIALLQYQQIKQTE